MIIIILTIKLYSNKRIRGGFINSHIINYMDYLHLKKHQINLQTGKFLINMSIQYLSSGQMLLKDNNKSTQAKPDIHLQPTVFTANYKRIAEPNSSDLIANPKHAFIQ